MHAKVSHGGLRFFAHDRVSPGCPSAGETPQHQALKSLLANEARKAGGVATIEAEPSAGDFGGWRADVLVTVAERRIALEAQLSTMALDLGRERTERYRRDGVEVVWFTTRDAAWLWQLPGVRIDPSPDGEDRWIVTRGVASFTAGGWEPRRTLLSLSRFIDAVVDGRTHEVAGVQWLTERLSRGGRVSERIHDDAVVIARGVDIERFRRHRRGQDAAARLAVERAARAEREAENRRKFQERQVRMMEIAIAASRASSRAAGFPGSVWVGKKYRWLPEGGSVARGDFRGGADHAFGGLIWVGSGYWYQLHAVVCPVAARVDRDMGRRWASAGVLVYAERRDEARRIAARLGWPSGNIRVPQPEPP